MKCCPMLGMIQALSNKFQNRRAYVDPENPERRVCSMRAACIDAAFPDLEVLFNIEEYEEEKRGVVRNCNARKCGSATAAHLTITCL